MFMVMEVPALAGKKDMVSGLILLKIFISTAFSGQILKSCEPTLLHNHIWFSFGFYLTTIWSHLCYYDSDFFIILNMILLYK